MPRYFLGLDLGGTNVKAGVVDTHGQLIGHLSVPTGTRGVDLAPTQVIRRLVAAGECVLAETGIRRSAVAGVGVVSPGQASLSRGVVIRAANLPQWKNVPLRARVGQGLKLPAILENDANAAAFGEYWVGAGRGRSGRRGKHLDNLFLITLGTGIGGGLIYERKVVRGSFDFATEIGHTIIIPGGEKCGCGQRGCLERYCSARFMARRASLRLADSRKLRKRSSLGKIFKDTGSLTAADIAQHAKAGDPFASSVWDEACHLLALACINVCRLIDPQMIVLAGGMSQAGHFLLDNVHRHFRAEWWRMTRPTVRLALARLGNDAGVIGAAGVAQEAYLRGALPGIGE